MTDVLDAMRGGELTFLDVEALTAFLVAQRWFASKAREVTGLEVLDAVPLKLDPPLLAVALVEARFSSGAHQIYQIPLGLRATHEGWTEAVIAPADGFTAYDALTDPELARRLLDLMRSGETVEERHSAVDFHWASRFPRQRHDEGVVCPMAGEQSNSSVVFDDTLVLKVYRRVEAGINPELELLRFLSERDFAGVAPLAGWYEYTGHPMETTLGLLQEFLPSAQDGWQLALDQLSEDPDRLLEEVRALGAVTGEMHAVLGSAPGEPSFAPEELSGESLALLTATVDEEIERVFLTLPDDAALAPIAGRGQQIQEKLRLFTRVPDSGKAIRVHGDYHLGQLLLTDRGWIIVDFEGEPARSLRERRRKRSPLRDVAGMMRSFAYAASASEIQRGEGAPQGWEERARGEFMDGYLETIVRSLLPAEPAGIEQLLATFELEKAVYELSYELNNRPDWIRVPVAGIVRLLEEPAQ